MRRDILAGKRVLEIGTMLAAPFAAHILAQLGAEVIKVESPDGDPTRSLVRGGPSGTYIAYSRGKKSLCLDLASPEGQAALHLLLARCDIVLHNLAPGSARRLGVTYEECARKNPEVVYCHIRGYNEGPRCDDLASNPIAEAATGVMDAHRIGGRPTRLGPSYHDQFAGCYAVIGILSALLSDGIDAESRKIEVGLYETGLHVAARDFAGVQLKMHLTGKPEREPSGEFSMPGYGSYETSDGRWIYLVMLTDRHWSDFWAALSLEVALDLATLRQRKKHRERVEALVGDTVRQLTYDEIAEKLAAARFGFTEVLPMERVLDAPQARQAGKLARTLMQDFSFDIPELPFQIASAEVEGDAAPLLGEHTSEILAWLGYSAAQCDVLAAARKAIVADRGAPLWAPMRPPAA